LIANHLRKKPLEKATMVSQISMIAMMLTEFASSQFLFRTLSREDQAILLKNNIPLYIQVCVRHCVPKYKVFYTSLFLTIFYLSTY